MKVYYLLMSALCVWISPTHSQFFYSHYTPLTQISPFFPQPLLATPPAVPTLTYTASPSAASVTYNLPSNPTPEFHGFGYRTDFKDGASSTVFYVTGPDAQHLQNFKDFPNFTRKVHETTVGKARSLASDITDVNAIPNAEGKIQSVLKPTDFQKIFDGYLPGVVNFYTFPAGTVSLTLARQLINNTANVTTETPSSEENVAAESVVNPKVVINDVDNVIKTHETTETITVTENFSETTTTKPTEDEEKQTTATVTEEAATAETTTTV